MTQETKPIRHLETTQTKNEEAELQAWRFSRAGGVDQVRLDSGAAITNLGKLDQKLWVALSCPVKGLELDERTLALIDTDKDGRVRAPEVIAAVNWAAANLKNPDDLTKESPALPLSAINNATPEGKQVPPPTTEDQNKDKKTKEKDKTPASNPPTTNALPVGQTTKNNSVLFGRRNFLLPA